MRLDKAVSNLDPKLDTGVVLKNESIFYLTGFFPTAFALLVMGEEPYLAVSEMDALLARDLEMEVRVVKNFKKEISFRGRVGIEKKYTTVGFVEEYLKGCKISDLKLIEEMRMIKDDSEIGKIKSSIEIAEELLGNLSLEGLTEREAAAKISYEISKVAAVAFDPIVASGKNSAVPHHLPSDTKIKSGEPVIVDLGSRYDHYNCDISRTFSEAKSKRFKEIYTAVCEAQKEGIKKMIPGAPVKDCDIAMRSVLREYGYEEYFVHSSGHGIGLEVHEAPRIWRESKDLFKKGMVTTIEPGVYVPGWGGIRIEDVVYVDKRPEILTSFPKLLNT